MPQFIAFILLLLILGAVFDKDKPRKSTREKIYEEVYQQIETEFKAKEYKLKQDYFRKGVVHGDSIGKVRYLSIGQDQGYERAYEEIRDSVMHHDFKKISVVSLQTSWPQLTGIGVASLIVVFILSVIKALFFNRFRDHLVLFFREQQWKPDSLVSKLQKLDREKRSWEERKNNLEASLKKSEALDQMLDQRMDQLDDLVKENPNLNIRARIKKMQRRKDQLNQNLEQGRHLLVGLRAIMIDLDQKQYELENGFEDEFYTDFYSSMVSLGMEIDHYLARALAIPVLMINDPLDQ